VTKTFGFEPAKAYSERLAKSIDVLWKLKEVFELVSMAGRPGGWLDSGKSKLRGHRTRLAALKGDPA
jgi:hypothetical protein